MNILEIIGKKRDGKELSKEEIEYYVTEYTKGTVTDYQAAALLMAIYIKGMNEQETTDLTMAMTNSGEVLDLSEIGDIIVDKHSTGGIGDKVTLILAPIIASLGIPVAKMSGRGLGITGGTIDKLESIPGYDVNLSLDRIIESTKDIGICITGATGDLAPADKKMYALRDSINCVDNIPLIASSIMSKKLACGTNKIVLEVTTGKGAFMKTKEDAICLAQMMTRIGKLANKETVCVLTSMDEPLGRTIGNSLEVVESIEFLKGKMEEDLKEVVLELGSYMIKLAGKGNNLEENKQKMLETIKNGKAFEKLKELVQNQGGEISYLDNTEKFEKAKNIVPVLAKESGFIKSIDAEAIGHLSVLLGAGRIRKEDSIDYSVGLVLNKKIGEEVQEGEPICYIHVNDETKIEEARERLQKAYEISAEQIDRPEVVLGIVD